MQKRARGLKSKLYCKKLTFIFPDKSRARQNCQARRPRCSVVGVYNSVGALWQPLLVDTAKNNKTRIRHELALLTIHYPSISFASAEARCAVHDARRVRDAVQWRMTVQVWVDVRWTK